MRALFRLACVLACAGAAATASAQANDRLRSPFDVRFDAAWLRALPWSSDATSLLETIEATAVSDRFSLAGLSAGEAARLGIHAASWTELQYRLGGFDVSDPERSGTPLLLVPRASLESLRLRTASLGATSGGPGALVLLDPLAPGRAWHGRFALLDAPAGFQADVARGAPPALARLREAVELSGVASGPLAGERLGGTFALEWERADRSERAAQASLRGERKSGLAQLQWTPGPRDEARLLAAGHDVRRPFAGRARLADAAVAEDERAVFVGASWRRRPVRGGRLQGALSYAHRSYAPPAEGGPPVALERLQSGPIQDSLRDPSRLGVVRGEALLSLRPWASGRLHHEVSALAQLEHSRLASDPAAAVTIAERVDARAARAWSFSAAEPSRRSLTRLGFAVQDRLSASERLDLELGLRLEAQNGSRQDAAGRIRWRDLLPHAAILARPFASRSFVAHAGFARYAARLPLRLLAFGDPAARSASVFRWSDSNRDGLFQASERGVLIARAGPGGSFVSLDEQLRAPRTTELAAGLAFEGGALRAWLSGVHRRTRGLVETTNVGVPASSYRVRLVPDTGVDLVGAGDDQLLSVYDRDPATFGRDRYLLTNPAGHDVTQEGVEAALELQRGEHLRLRLGGTASLTRGAGANRGFQAGENDPGLPGELFDDPNADSFKTGRLFFDRAYTLKVAGIYELRGWTGGFAARYQDGQPFARVVIADGLAQGPEIVAAVRRGDHRFTYILTLDARLAKSFGVGRARVTASVEAFSLARQRREVEEYVVSGPAFRSVTAVQPPRALRLGLSAAF